MDKRKICVVTGTRAEYGRLYGLMKTIKNDEKLILQIIATAMHLSPEFGLTYKNIEQDGFEIDEKIEMLLSSDTTTGISKSIGVGIIGFADAFARLKPDIVVLLGDRYEILAAAEAALVANIPIAHIHGGEVTEGAIDESIRHAVTKMSQMHFVTESIYRKRVIQLGENPDHVYEVGALGNDNIVNMNLLNRDQLENEIKFNLGEKYFLVTYHPVTVHSSASKIAMKELFAALDVFEEYKILFTKANSDAGGREINKLIDQYMEKNKKRVYATISLGQLRYLSAMKYCSAVIGNSSSGILEAPIFHKPSINIGNRQKGRTRELSVIDCADDKAAIVSSINLAFSNQFTEQIQNMSSLYVDGKVAERIKNVLKEIKLQNICIKHFYDVEWR